MSPAWEAREGSWGTEVTPPCSQGWLVTWVKYGELGFTLHMSSHPPEMGAEGPALPQQACPRGAGCGRGHGTRAGGGSSTLPRSAPPPRPTQRRAGTVPSLAVIVLPSPLLTYL